MTVNGDGVAVPKTGYYRVMGQITTNPISGGGGYTQLTPRVNDIATQFGCSTAAICPNSSYATVVTFDEIYCNAGDVVTLFMSNASGVAMAANAGLIIVEYVGQ
jgi:hypothetical protein